MIKIFTCRGCNEAEELADETFNRVCSKIDALSDSYVGDPALYFYGVAHKIFLEHLRKRPIPPQPPPPITAADDDVEQEYDCLEVCMQRLPPNQRELALDYYREDKRAKIDRRKALAENLGIGLNALRIRAHRIRLTLQACVQECMESKASG
ncbi:MAG TPA: hypothetical protein VGX92_17510 [Pyrinomonadaceae bacterium]|nr:hypothetical protein [Pyrinomonadaceae bacterium]